VTWIRSSRCDSATCVEAWPDPAGDTVQVRDSKDPDGPRLRFGRGAWETFVAGVKAGAFDEGGGCRG